MATAARLRAKAAERAEQQLQQLPGKFDAILNLASTSGKYLGRNFTLVDSPAEQASLLLLVFDLKVYIPKRANSDIRIAMRERFLVYVRENYPANQIKICEIATKVIPDVPQNPEDILASSNTWLSIMLQISHLQSLFRANNAYILLLEDVQKHKADIPELFKVLGSRDDDHGIALTDLIKTASALSFVLKLMNMGIISPRFEDSLTWDLYINSEASAILKEGLTHEDEVVRVISRSLLWKVNLGIDNTNLEVTFLNLIKLAKTPPKMELDGLDLTEALVSTMHPQLGSYRSNCETFIESFEVAQRKLKESPSESEESEFALARYNEAKTAIIKHNQNFGIVLKTLLPVIQELYANAFAAFKEGLADVTGLRGQAQLNASKSDEIADKLAPFIKRCTETLTHTPDNPETFSAEWSEIFSLSTESEDSPWVRDAPSSHRLSSKKKKKKGKGKGKTTPKAAAGAGGGAAGGTGAELTVKSPIPVRVEVPVAAPLPSISTAQEGKKLTDIFSKEELDARPIFTLDPRVENWFENPTTAAKKRGFDLANAKDILSHHFSRAILEFIGTRYSIHLKRPRTDGREDDDLYLIPAERWVGRKKKLGFIEATIDQRGVLYHLFFNDKKDSTQTSNAVIMANAGINPNAIFRAHEFPSLPSQDPMEPVACTHKNLSMTYSPGLGSIAFDQPNFYGEEARTTTLIPVSN